MSLRNVSNLVRGFQLLGYGDASSAEGANDGKELYTQAAQRAKAWLQVRRDDYGIGQNS
jgi:hypothetical protein